MFLSPGTKFNGMTILRRCGGGAYGEVYYCQDLTGQPLALKICPKGGQNDNSWQRELKGLVNYRKISSDLPSLLKIFHVEETPECLYYTMEPADMVRRGEQFLPDTLALRLLDGPLPPSQVVSVLQSILEGITYLHRAGIAHRDIKPENILFVQGLPKLADMGLLSTLSGMSTMAGTLEFIPPEVRSGSSSSSGEEYQRNDLYAFGKLIYCCVSGRAADEFPSIAYDAFSHCPVKYLFRLSLKLCEREPGRRMSTLQAVHEDFTRILRISQYGETLGDQLHYCWHSFLLLLRKGRQAASRLLLRHGYLLPLCLSAAGGTYWLRQQARTAVFNDSATVLHQNERIGFEATIPQDWIPIMMDEILAEIDAIRKEDPGALENLSPEMGQLLKYSEQLRDNPLPQDVILCGVSQPGEPSESIHFKRIPGAAAEFFDCSDEMLRFTFFNNLVDAGFSPVFHRSSRGTYNGHPCRVIDYSLMKEMNQNRVCFFRDGEDVVLAELSANKETFPQRLLQFENVLNSMKFLPPQKGEDS